jgi:SAM-dependent methyltransferase
MATITAQPGRFTGVTQIFIDNWPFYAGTVGIDILATLLLATVSPPGPVSFAICLVATVSTFWALSSLVVSHLVYDRSALYEFTWLPTVVRSHPKSWVNIHAGLDQTSEALVRLFPVADPRILDIYDRSQMGKPSITRVREHSVGLLKAERANPLSLPLGDSACDTVFLIFAAHELRHRSARLQLFREIKRSLQPGGRLVLIEHLRDFNNFLAFGPGAFHFFSRHEWLMLGNHAGLFPLGERSVTPFVRCLVFTKFA